MIIAISNSRGARTWRPACFALKANNKMHCQRPMTNRTDPLSRYGYMWKLSRSRWAWEALRRTDAFLEDTERHGPDEVSVRPACRSITSLRPRVDQHAAHRWGLNFFPDPRQNGFPARQISFPRLALCMRAAPDGLQNRTATGIADHRRKGRRNTPSAQHETQKDIHHGQRTRIRLGNRHWV